VNGDFNSSINLQNVRFRPKNELMIASITVGTDDSSSVYFYINPNRISYNYKQKVTRKKSRAGWIDEYWGEELDTLQVEAVSGGFKTDSKGYSGVSDSRDVTNDAFLRLEQIIKAYRDGGLSYGVDGFAESFVPVRFKYDKFLYYGFFEALNLEENTDIPFMMSFNFTFKVLGTDVTF